MIYLHLRENQLPPKFQKNFAKYQILIYNKEQEYTEEGEWHDFG